MDVENTANRRDLFDNNFVTFKGRRNTNREFLTFDAMFSITITTTHTITTIWYNDNLKVYKKKKPSINIDHEYPIQDKIFRHAKGFYWFLW